MKAANKITLDEALHLIENYVPASIPPEQYAQVRPYVIQTMTAVVTYVHTRPKVLPLTKRAVDEYTRALTNHCVTVFDAYGEIPDGEEAFNGELIAWSTDQLQVNKDTKTRYGGRLRKIGAILKEVSAFDYSQPLVELTSEPYTRAELHEIIRTVRAQSTQARCDNGTVVVALGLSGMQSEQVRETRAKHVDVGPPVIVRINERNYIVPTVLADDFLKVVDKRNDDAYLLAPDLVRDSHTVSGALRHFSYGHTCPPISLRRLHVTWSGNLFTRGISRKAYLALTGTGDSAFDIRQKRFPVDERAVLETSGLLTDLMIVGTSEIEQDVACEIEPMESFEIQPFTVIDGGKMS